MLTFPVYNSTFKDSAQMAALTYPYINRYILYSIWHPNWHFWHFHYLPYSWKKSPLWKVVLWHLSCYFHRIFFSNAISLQNVSCGVIKCLYCLCVYLCLLLFRISASWPIAFSLEMFWHFHLGMSARLHFHLSLILPSILVISSLFFVSEIDR